ncbi:hypothetical protein F4778DRAFT_782072 [Xylariomycetidae sp. FL2044]|nr:hypothetical protein F4778DRAFT_782072 [Xylariomycetidae sp. FL2044]
MTPTVGSAFAHEPSASDIYDPDEVFPQNSPLMKPYRPKFEPSPSPPAIPPPIIRPSQGDAILIHYLDGGKRPEIAAEAGVRPLDQPTDEDDDQSKSDSDESGDEEDIRSDMSPVPVLRPVRSIEEASAADPVDLRFLASNALAAAANAVSKPADSDNPQSPDQDAKKAERPRPVEALVLNGTPQELYSPRHRAHSQVLMHPGNVRSPTTLQSPAGHGELPPIQAASPKSDSSSHDPLPSIRSQLYEQLTGPSKDLPLRHGSQFPHSPPGAQPRMAGIPGASPPISPHEYRHPGMPSPAQTIPAMSPYYYSSTSGSNHRADYGGSNADTPNADMLTPAASITDKMSIDNMTNPQMSPFVCTFQGCTAPPFQTQYLLNSHANVHSSARPHYCPVKGCPRSEGGKGFKRKNEMIRHGLVHDSPGYVCPFCPDREHKYPRPDNLQRHVRVHHVDKDKDDPALRDVLSQRPDGPNRGRRRRGGP